MKTLLRIALFFVPLLVFSACATEDDQPIPDKPVTLRGEMGGVAMKMSTLMILRPGEVHDFDGLELSFSEINGNALDFFTVRIEDFSAKQLKYAVGSNGFSMIFNDAMQLSGANKGEWHAVSGILEISTYEEKRIKGKIASATFENIPERNKTMVLKNVEFDVTE